MISPLTVGAGVAAVMAGPTLYTLVQTGQLDGTSAFARGLLVTGVATIGAVYVQDLITRYQRESARKERQKAQQAERLRLEAERLVRAQAQAKEAQNRTL